MSHGTGRRRFGLWSGLTLAIGTIFSGSAAYAAAPAKVAPVIPGFDRLADAKADAVTRGQLLLGEMNCVSCHKPESNERVQPRAAPDLTSAGARLTPQYLREYLLNPHAAKPGAVMPDVFHASEARPKEGAVEALTHYLVSLGGPMKSATSEGSKLDLDAGEKLFHSVGCVACHAPRGKDGKPMETKSPSVPLPINLASKTTVDQLQSFLQNPHATRPSGRMPSLNLTSDEAKSIAIYLLKDQLDNPQTKDAAPVAVKGLKVSYWEGKVANAKIETFDKLGAPKATGRATSIDAKLPGARPNNWAAKFSGTIHIAKDGKYTFFLASDDGSRMYIDGKQVVEVDGVHPVTEKKAQIELKAGQHPFVVTFFQEANEATLRAEWQGPGIKRQPIPADVLSSIDGKPMVPTGTAPFELDGQKVQMGKMMFSALGCAACHNIPGQKPMKEYAPLAKLNPAGEGGCLSDDTKKSVPYYGLSAAQRDALKAAIEDARNPSKPMTPGEKVTQTLASLNCYACHKRDNVGGPAADRDGYFTMTAEFDMGDEGRLPPTLTGVGAKLKPEAFEKIICESKLHIRQVLATRMPKFEKPTVDRLLTSVSAADGAKDPLAGPKFAEASARDGRQLFGVKGLGCANCHGVLNNKSLGMPAPDLTSAYERLQHGWYSKLMHDPNSINPATRMPGFWPGDVVMIKDVGGNTAQGQIDAIYNYLSLGSSMALPAGLSATGKSELAPSEEPILHRTFFADVGPRAVLVGYPEQLSVAFDANLVRLATVWRGKFFDTQGMWDARGGQALGPLGTDIFKFPATATFAVLPDAAAAWPKPVPNPEDGNIARNVGGKFLGYELDKEKRPTFRYKFSDVEVNEKPLPKLNPGGALLVRQFTLNGSTANVYLLAAAGKTIEQKSPTEFIVDSKVMIRLSGLPADAKPVIRGEGAAKELIVPISLKAGQATFEVEMAW